MAGESNSSSRWFNFDTHKNTTKAITDIKDKQVIEEIYQEKREIVNLIQKFKYIFVAIHRKLNTNITIQ
jgi:hypothetical protein